MRTVLVVLSLVLCACAGTDFTFVTQPDAQATEASTDWAEDSGAAGDAQADESDAPDAAPVEADAEVDHKLTGKPPNGDAGADVVLPDDASVSDAACTPLAEPQAMWQCRGNTTPQFTALDDFCVFTRGSYSYAAVPLPAACRCQDTDTCGCVLAAVTDPCGDGATPTGCVTPSRGAVTGDPTGPVEVQCP